MQAFLAAFKSEKKKKKQEEEGSLKYWAWASKSCQDDINCNNYVFDRSWTY